MDLTNLYCLDLYLKNNSQLFKIEELIGYSKKELEEIGRARCKNNPLYLALLYRFQISDAMVITV